MTEKLSPESTELIVLPIEEQISQELVKANVTEAIIADLRERLLPLKIAGIEDKETYLIVQAGRKECKALRVAAKKICTSGREQAVAISKAWIAKEKEVTGQIGEVEDYLEKQENEFEAEVAKEKEARKRKQEEQLIVRQQTLTNMGALYSDGNFVLGEVSFEFSLIKESEEDIWTDTILPKFKEEYEKVEAEQIEQKRKEQERADELKRQQEELEVERKRLSAEADRLQVERERQELEAAKKRSDQFEFRSQQLKSIGFEVYGVDWYAFREFKIAMSAVWDWDDNAWGLQLVSAKQYVDQVLAEEAKEKRKEQERKDLQNKRYAELLPFKEYGESVEMDGLWSLTPETYSDMLGAKKAVFDFEQEEQKRKIADDAAKKERERIEEEQRKAEVIRKNELRKNRIETLNKYNKVYAGDVAEVPDEQFFAIMSDAKLEYDGLIAKQEEERKAEQLAQSTDKRKWEEVLVGVNSLIILLNEVPMRSGQYRKKAAILREKLEEIKAL